jgi:predicted Zn-ribbon and HTH transcriptional regulator
MGEIADMLLDGTLCEGCGEVFDDIMDGEDSPGFPRRCPECEMEELEDE